LIFSSAGTHLTVWLLSSITTRDERLTITRIDVVADRPLTIELLKALALGEAMAVA